GQSRPAGFFAMNSAFYQSITDSNQWLTLWPEISLGLLALVVLALDLLLKPADRHKIGRVAILGQVIVLIALLGIIVFESVDPLLQRVVEQPDNLDGLLSFTAFGDAGRFFILLTSIIVSYLAQLYFQRQAALPRAEFYHLQLVVAAAMMMLVQSTQFV